MKEPIILGVDIAKKKFDVALLVNDKQKHKVFTKIRKDLENYWVGSEKGGRACPSLSGGIKYLW